ncbi:MAG: lipid-A-disaccharide synthase [Candidatus Amoebophilus sp. 36-38]|nr:MAG: lipid-A-disaccharide synthase [Candidatus Amoebophilus sp. 36-38]
MRYYIIAGEKSGDIYGSRLAQALQQIDPKAVCRGWGGNQMQQAGIELVVHYRELAVMGLRFLGIFRKLYTYLKYCQKDIAAFNPDAVILIDYSGFNLRIAKFAKKKHIKTFYYISPKLWAWNASRIHTIKAYVDRIFSIFPFEKKFYEQYDYQAVTYVGNPLLEEIESYKKDPYFIANNHLDKRPIIALLPGSRIQEISSLLPIMLTLAPSLPGYQFIVAAISELPPHLYLPVEHIPNVRIVYDRMHDVLAHAHLAIVTSGTATLETAYLNVPQVVIYKTDRFTYHIAKWLVKLRYISLVNILAEKEVIRELIQDKLTPITLLHAVNELINAPDCREKQLASYESIRNLLGKDKASTNVAYQIVESLTTQ